MDFHIQREALLKTLQKVSGVTEKRQAMPILSNVLLRTQQDVVSFTATDTDMELVVSLGLEQPTESAETTVSARKLMDICRVLPEQQKIKISIENQLVTLRSGRAKFSLSTLPADDFPASELGPAELELTLPRRELCYLLHRTHFAMANQDVRYYLNGLLLEIGADRLCAVATDGYRLALCEYGIALPQEKKQQIIIPRKAVVELLRLTEEDAEDAVLTVNKNHLKIDMMGLCFTSKLIDGRYPEFTNIIPMGCDKTMQVDKDVLKNMLLRMSALCNDRFKSVRFALQTGVLSASTSNAEHEQAEETVEIDYTGQPLEVVFNIRYLLDILAVVSGTIRFSFKDVNSSVLIEETATTDVKYVVMPMRL